jgi:hypothetical protein
LPIHAICLAQKQIHTFFGDHFRDREAVGKVGFRQLIAMPWALLALNLAANGLSAAPKRGPMPSPPKSFSRLEVCPATPKFA